MTLPAAMCQQDTLAETAETTQRASTIPPTKESGISDLFLMASTLSELQSIILSSGLLQYH